MLTVLPHDAVRRSTVDATVARSSEESLLERKPEPARPTELQDPTWSSSQPSSFEATFAV